jgi:hypothetical protein
LFDQGGVVDHQHGVGPADEPVGRSDQLVLERRRGPGRARQEVMQLLDIAGRDPSGH